MKLHGKTAIITGAGAGMGRAASIRFAKEGANVVVADLNETAANETVALIKSENGSAVVFTCNVMKKDQVNELVQYAKNTFGSVDILVNNAGLGQNPINSEDASEEELDRLIGVNLKGVYFGCQAAIPYMKEKKAGVIINTASISAERPRKGNAMYIATKGAVMTLTKALAMELAPEGIRVVGVNPVAVDTNVLKELIGSDDYETSRDQITTSIPIGRLATPEDIANAMLFLASDEASMVTGSFINVDGGRGI
ncbi:MAG TPA: SDR family oxidoreductase [Ureibacillus sp.]|nr:SDR family oxidoreductase [Ureibacillus sp.]